MDILKTLVTDRVMVLAPRCISVAGNPSKLTEFAFSRDWRSLSTKPSVTGGISKLVVESCVLYLTKSLRASWVPLKPSVPKHNDYLQWETVEPLGLLVYICYTSSLWKIKDNLTE